MNKFSLIIKTLIATLAILHSVNSLAKDEKMNELPDNIFFIKTFGAWQHENKQGMFRVVLTDNRSEKQYSEAFLQWLESSEDGKKITFTIALDAINKTKVYKLFTPKIKGNKLHFKAVNQHTKEATNFTVEPGSIGGDFELAFENIESKRLTKSKPTTLKQVRNIPVDYANYSRPTF